MELQATSVRGTFEARHNGEVIGTVTDSGKGYWTIQAFAETPSDAFLALLAAVTHLKRF